MTIREWIWGGDSGVIEEHVMGARMFVGTGGRVIAEGNSEREQVSL
jgi:hypothetical protein